MNRLLALLIFSASVTPLVGCGSSSASENNKALQNLQDVDSPRPYSVPEADRKVAVDELVELRRTMIALEGKLIAPAQEDLIAFEDFLKIPGTGLARIFPRFSGNERRPLLVNGQGAYYQFKNQTNEYGQGSDIEYSTSNGPSFSVGFAGVNYGYMTSLGKVDIRQIDEQHASVNFALSLVSPNQQPEAVWRAEQMKASAGIAGGGTVFMNNTPAFVGTSYVVRSVSESRYDIVAAFQVVRRDTTDGSLILAWKLIKEFEKPVLKRN